MALLETLVDAATSAPDYAGKWAGTTATMQSAITNSGGAHHIPPAASGTAFRELKTVFGDYIIDGSYVAVEISGIPTGAGEGWIRIYLNGSGQLTSKAYAHWLFSTTGAPTIAFGHDNAGVSQGSTSISYSGSTHRFIAIVHRETGGNGTFDWYTAQTPTAAPPTNGVAGPTNGWTRRWTDAAGINPGVSQQLSIFQVNDSTAAANSGNLDVAGVNTGWEAVVSPPANTVAPAVTGTATTGNVLTCSTGTWTNTPTSFAYQWTRDGASIGAATASTYTIVLADEAHTLACTVTATNAGGSASAASNSVSIPVTPPANSVAPALTGTATTGQTLTVSNGTWSGSPTFARQWKRNGTAISGATATTYVLQVADEGTSVKATVTATNAGGSVSADSNAVTPTAANTAPSNTVAPALSGAAQTGNVLTVSTGTWAGSPAPTFAYQWKRNTTNIGTNANTFTLTATEVGTSVKCVVTATNTAGSASADSNIVVPTAVGTGKETPFGVPFGPITAETAGTRAILQPINFTPLSDAAAKAKVRFHGWEPRAANATANARVPTAGELTTFRTAAAAQWPGGTGGYLGLVTGNPGARTGGGTWTTDEILQWAAYKWGLEEDLVRTKADTESTWLQSANGDGGRSFGLFQIKSVVIGSNFIWQGAYPLVQLSSAFNADFFGAQMRITYDGDQPGLGAAYNANGAGDMWGAVGWWFSGAYRDAAALTSIASNQAAYAAQPWETRTGTGWTAYAGQND